MKCHQRALALSNKQTFISFWESNKHLSQKDIAQHFWNSNQYCRRHTKICSKTENKRNFNVMTFNVILKRNLTEPWI